ncbi:YafY family transcriptional regulator [Georgenia sp. TF02-10]|uniref:helix-turn-helix transcriptional regulator n=1 Tax=Georgenia sp. TF02-10 TaxID=2917725 RepID=UPI001FA74150|nr:YafY family protein [Georgenia sp. TF02-10]UNX55133.1 YafY family transcriptional regulator [Georgenia sp. TF02-10]
MPDPTARALRLLSLLQTHRHWTGAALAERLGVTDRTLRRDVDRLRELGYRVAARPGSAGGYQLEGGGSLPPLLLDDEEAVAIAVGLRAAAVTGVGQDEHTTLSALAKLEQVLPRNLRRRVTALHEHTVPSVRPGAHVAGEVLAQLALLCRDHERLRFRYTSADGTETARHVEPHALVPHERRWYFVAWDVGRGDWRTFRIDRMRALLGTGVRVPARDLPAADAAEFVRAAHGRIAYRYSAVVHLRASPAQVREHFGVWAQDATENPDGGMDWPIGGSRPLDMLYALLWIPPEMPWTISGDPEVTAALAGFRDRLSRAL